MDELDRELESMIANENFINEYVTAKKEGREPNIQPVPAKTAQEWCIRAASSIALAEAMLGKWADQPEANAQVLTEMVHDLFNVMPESLLLMGTLNALMMKDKIEDRLNDDD